MSTNAASGSDLSIPFQQLLCAKDVLRREADALSGLAQRLDENFCGAVSLLYRCQGSVIVSGMGKAGLVGQKIAATLASTGTRSHFLHPAEAIHGDLGRIHHDDVVMILSHSGETEEIVRLLPSLRALRVPMIAVTGRPESQLGHYAAVVLDLGHLTEACLLGLAPSTSTTAMLGLGDALALVTSQMRGFSPDDFAKYHPGGSLGRRLTKVEDVMRPLGRCRMACQTHTVREVFVQVGRPGRRTGAVMLTDAEGSLTGIFTDSDLARLFESRCDGAIDESICHVMTQNPATIRYDALLTEAVEILTQRRISELPVVDQRQMPRGLIDITDVVGLLPLDQRDAFTSLQPAESRLAEAENDSVIPFPNKSRVQHVLKGGAKTESTPDTQ